MADFTDVVCGSIEEARALAPRAIPAGHELIREELLVGGDGEARATGDTEESALGQAEKNVPLAAVVQDRRVLDPGQRVVTISARDAAAAREAAGLQPSERITSVDLVHAGERRLLGLLKSKPTFRLGIQGPVRVAIRYVAPPRVRLHTRARADRWRDLLETAGDGFGSRTAAQASAHAELERACHDPSIQEEVLAVVRKEYKYDRLVMYLLQYGGTSVVPRLISEFSGCGPYGGLQDKVIRFIHRVAPESLRKLAPLLQDRYWPTVRSAAEALGLGECCESELLSAGRGVNSGHVRDGLLRAGTPFARRVADVLEGHERTQVTAMGLEAETAEDLVARLRRIAARWASNEDSYAELDLPARAIGEEFFRRGGMAAMRGAHAALGAVRGARTLDMVWDGIGDWRG